MEPEPFTILIQSRHCRSKVVDGELVLEFALAGAYQFKEKRYVRLFAATGPSEGGFVHLSFATLNPFGNSYRRHIAVLAPGTIPGPWTRVDGNFICTFNTLSVGRLDGEPFEQVPEENLSFYLQVVPGTWLHHVGAGRDLGV